MITVSIGDDGVDLVDGPLSSHNTFIIVSEIFVGIIYCNYDGGFSN